jgi:2-polyprenyl-3-methyl-5-hydroxy-6-metoxy-1,4-benzoquinol methylase
MVMGQYYNETYRERQLDLDEKGNTFEKIAMLWPAAKAGTINDILDIGCGAGSVSAQLVRNGHRVIGLDIMEDAIVRACQRGLDARVHDLNEPLPFGDQSFDVVIGLDIFEHVFDPTSLLREVRRVLRPGAVAIIMMPLHLDLRQRIRILRGKGIVSYEHLMYDPSCSSANYFHIRFFTLDEVYRWVASEGFAIVGRQFRPMTLDGVMGIGGRLASRYLMGKATTLRPSMFSSGVLLRVRTLE